MRSYKGICYDETGTIVFDKSIAIVYKGHYLSVDDILRILNAPVIKFFIETFREVPKVEWNGEVYELQGTGVPIDGIEIIDDYLVRFGNEKPSIVFDDGVNRYEWDQETGELHWIQLYRECEGCAPKETGRKFLGKITVELKPGFIDELIKKARELSRPNHERAIETGLPYDPLFKKGDSIITGFKRVDLNNYRDDFIGTRKAKRYFMVPYREGLYTVVIPNDISGNILTADSINDIPENIKKDIKLFRIYQWNREPVFVFVKPVPHRKITKVYIFTEKSFRAKESRTYSSEHIMPVRVLTFRGRTVIEDIEARVSAFLEVYTTHAPQYTEYPYIHSVYD